MNQCPAPDHEETEDGCSSCTGSRSGTGGGNPFAAATMPLLLGALRHWITRQIRHPQLVKLMHLQQRDHRTGSSQN
ncbi:MAG: hypothetical protein FIA89_00925 [Geobacter sp.]|nr:hypothetical protein [Geobacter sp.]